MGQPVCCPYKGVGVRVVGEVGAQPCALQIEGVVGEVDSLSVVPYTPIKDFLDQHLPADKPAGKANKPP